MGLNVCGAFLKKFIFLARLERADVFRLRKTCGAGCVKRCVPGGILNTV